MKFYKKCNIFTKDKWSMHHKGRFFVLEQIMRLLQRTNLEKYCSKALMPRKKRLFGRHSKEKQQKKTWQKKRQIRTPLSRTFSKKAIYGQMNLKQMIISIIIQQQPFMYQIHSFQSVKKWAFKIPKRLKTIPLKDWHMN